MDKRKQDNFVPRFVWVGRGKKQTNSGRGEKKCAKRASRRAGKGQKKGGIEIPLMRRKKETHVLERENIGLGGDGTGSAGQKKKGKGVSFSWCVST